MYAGLKEIREPASWILAIIAMTVSVGKIWRITIPEFYTSPYFIGILIGFVAHELAHRGVARKYGLYAEFIASPGGLLITFATGFIPGLVILAPGYVAVYTPGPYALKGAIRSVEAGPAANIVIGLAALAASHFMTGYWSLYLGIIALVNGWIAFFNLIPIPPLDGSKIMRSDFNTWIIMLAAAIALWWIP